MAVTPARDALRHATGAAHERLHRIPAFTQLAAGRLDRPSYVALLRRLLGFHLGLEAALAAAPPLDPFGIRLEERQRSALLRQDLADLGAAPVAPVAAVPVPASAAAALGSLYVSEGATLGGRVLAAALDGLLGETEVGRRFLLGHGPRHGEMWRALCAAIEACGADPRRLAAMIEGASATFGAFEAWFTRPEPAPRRPG